MEHCCYTLTEYNPGLVHALNQKKQFHLFASSIYSVGDTFRAELNKIVLDSGDQKGTWEKMMTLENSAQTLFDRCSRAYRTVISPP
eukprot:2629374-Rhodomonas_salina.1